MKNSKCFISYCSIDALPEKMVALVEYLEKLASNYGYNIDFLLDKREGVGNSLNQFMDKILQVDSIIVICTPEYKKRYENEGNKFCNTGVYKECQLMKQRLDEYNNEQEDFVEDKAFKIYPLILKSDNIEFNEMVPNFMQPFVREKINLLDFEVKKNVSKGRSKKKSKYYVNEQSKELYEDIFLDCIAETCVIRANKSEYLDMEIEDKLKKLIYNQKAESAPKLDRRIFVTTSYYKTVKDQTSYFLIGRKGSGKTTTKEYFSSQNMDKYKGVIELKIDNIDINNVYNYLFHGPYDANENIKNLCRDFEEIFTYEKLIDFIWITYIYVYSMYVVACEYKSKNSKIKGMQREEFKSCVKFVNLILNKVDSKYRWMNETDISNILYSFALSNTYRFFDDVVTNSRNDERFFASDVQSQLTHRNLVRHIFGAELIENFNRGLNKCSKRILFTLDGFDVASDLYRKQALSSPPDERVQRADFEIRWMASLIEIIQTIKSNTTDTLFGLIDVCFLFPKDLFMEILSINRDKYKYSSSFCEIKWTGNELAKMIQKRLEALANYPYSSEEKKGLTTQSIIERILQKEYSTIPSKICIETQNGRKYEIDLFLYMLRYSFWRPRDLLMILTSMLRVFYGRNNLGIPINPITIKTTIKTASKTIVNTDFFREFDTLWPDIRKNIKAFEGKNIVLDSEEMKEIVLSKNFDIVLDYDNKHIQDFNEIIKFLFEIGFIGLIVDKRYRKTYNMITQQGFIFNEGISCLRGFLNNDFANCKFLINPVFIETLHLNINTEEYIGVSNWADLEEYDSIVQLRMRSDCLGDVE